MILANRAAEVFTIALLGSAERRWLSSSVASAWKAVAASAAGVGECHMQCTPVTRHRRSPDKAALFGSVHKAGERGLLHPEALRQFSHSSGAEGQHAYQPGLNRSEVMALGDARIDCSAPGGRAGSVRRRRRDASTYRRANTGSAAWQPCAAASHRGLGLVARRLSIGHIVRETYS